jgi:hypothetical protein
VKGSKKLDKNKRVKAMARERVGIPAPSRPLEEHPANSKPKHKKPLTNVED